MSGILSSGCMFAWTPVHPEMSAVGGHDLLAISDALDALIADGRDSASDRIFAYSLVDHPEPETAGSLLAKASITGRYVQMKGLLGAHLVKKVEQLAKKSIALDPNFRGGAATRLLGTLYVLAPAALLEHGDSEQGLDLLEKLVKAHPEVLENHLRVAEAYVSLGDPDPAKPHLCACMKGREKLHKDDLALLRHLMNDTGGKPCGREAVEEPTASVP